MRFGCRFWELWGSILEAWGQMLEALGSIWGILGSILGGGGQKATARSRSVTPQRAKTMKNHWFFKVFRGSRDHQKRASKSGATPRRGCEHPRPSYFGRIGGPGRGKGEGKPSPRHVRYSYRCRYPVARSANPATAHSIAARCARAACCATDVRWSRRNGPFS